MKRIFVKTTVFLFLMIGLSGCYLKSVHPLIDQKNAIFINGLDGVYEDEDSRWTFASDNQPESIKHIIEQYERKVNDPDFEAGEEEELDFTGYLIMFENLEDLKAEPDLFIGTAGEIAGERFLNLKLFDMADEEVTFVQTHILFVNTFSRITLSNDELSLELFASKWIEEQIRDNRVRIKHEVVGSQQYDDSQILITASTEELQAFVGKYKDDKDAYEDPIKLKRVKNAVQ